MWLAIPLFAVLHVVCIRTGPFWLRNTTKVIPIVLMIVTLTLSDSFQLLYAKGIVLGLVFSLIGDLFFIHSGEKLTAGIIAFTIAQICYGYSFGLISAWHFTFWIPLLLFGLGLCAYFFFKPDLKHYRLLIATYIIILMSTFWMALEYYTSGKTQSSALAVIGCFKFVTSGIIFAFQHFSSSSVFTNQVVMVTYYSAQILITLSVLAIVTRYV
ncbi:lysoplasmalogenase [Vibrio sp. CAU 1672]|uniref:lysoplasmalogenase n=1 Tax=Vibrio sp. CAU 1672 TaxID=3032594 RepID=UPI0023DAD658|nr:lysoplasmalogenase [Vibrio sp. CAU 1672]MDF2154833.1 lysoplasmalogenase [Vibrio sp. CAU 1672]